MPDTLLEAADSINHSGDALFAGDSNEIYVVHNKPILEGKLFRTGGISVMIRRRATKEEYLERCPQVPGLLLPGSYYFYLGVIVSASTKTHPCAMLEGEDTAYCALTDTILTELEFKMYACTDGCNFEKASPGCPSSPSQDS